MTKVKELSYHRTRLGDLTLRVRNEPLLANREVFEVKLGDDYLMSSLFTESERQLAAIGLAELADADLDVVVGGLGLGYTAAAVLENPRVRSLLVIDLFAELIDWHIQNLVPMSAALTSDQRCRFRQGDFFVLAKTGFDSSDADRRFDAILLDIDHSPAHWLDPKNAAFYGLDGLSRLAGQLKPGGAFALWSNDAADERFVRHLESVFESAAAHNIEFANPYSNSVSVNSVYVARVRA